MKSKLALIAFVSSAVFYSCKKDIFNPGGDVQHVKAAGDNCTVYDDSELAFSFRINGMTTQQQLDFFVGNSFFNQNWVESPASTTARDGLGPLFNTQSCSSCHFRDGRGAPFSGGGVLFRLSVPGGNPEPIYGEQFQDKGISTVSSEGDINITYVEMPGTYDDGTSYSLRVPSYDMVNLNYGAMAADVMVSPRCGNQMIGLGLLEVIPESTILANADENDADGDGISGRPNYVYDPTYGTTVLGRFGWKANTGSMPTQVAAAFNGDIGIKTNLFPDENHTVSQSVLNGLPDGGIVEIPDDDLAKVVLYCRTIGVPNRRNQQDLSVQRGETLFNELKCAKCHTPTMKTGNAGDIQPLKNVIIHPYSDMLIHDMGDGLADNRPDGQANGNEWRTQPLWGIGLISTVNGHTYFLHDGRARSIEEAILWHGGEAQESQEKFKALNASDRAALLDFVHSL